LIGRQNAKISIGVNVDRFIGLRGRCECSPGARCLRSRLNCGERDYEQDACSFHGDDLARHSNAENAGLKRYPTWHWMVFSLDVSPAEEDGWDRDAIVRGFLDSRHFAVFTEMNAPTRDEESV